MAPAQNADLLVADFDNGKIETVQGLAMVVMADEQFGGTSDARLTLIHPGAERSRSALRIFFRITGDFANPFSGVWALLGSEGLPTDMSAYRGVRFHARSKEGTFLAGVGQFSGQSAFYLAPFETRPEWTVVELPFDQFRRAMPRNDGSVLAPTNAVSIAFNVSSQLRGQFDLDIDRVQLYR
ncbi:MAG: CIA30 family protein [Vicinamibacterales bacterium]